MKYHFTSRAVAVCVALSCALAIVPSVSAAGHRPKGGTTRAAHEAQVTARNSVHKAFDGVIKASRSGFQSAFAADLKTYNAALKKAKADNSKTEEDAARAAFQAAVKAANTARQTAEKNAQGAWIKANGHSH